MSKAQELLQLAKANELTTVKAYLLVVKTTPAEFKAMREELMKHNYFFNLVPDSKVTKSKDVKSIVIEDILGERHELNPIQEVWVNRGKDKVSILPVNLVVGDQFRMTRDGETYNVDKVITDKDNAPSTATGPTYSIYLTTTTGTYLIAKGGKLSWFKERGLEPI